MVTHLLDCCGKDSLKKFYWDTDVGNACLCIDSKVCSYSVHVDDIKLVKLAARKQNLNLMWKKLMKLADLGEPTSFLDHVYLGCTQRECKSNEKIIDEY